MHLQPRIAVTGGSGFLGSHLCERLLGQGAEVICIDNFSPVRVATSIISSVKSAWNSSDTT
jgi:nucleoside-diphosphate-sugar epimerase